MIKGKLVGKELEMYLKDMKKQNLDVRYYMPKKKGCFATSTVATYDLIVAVAIDGGLTFKESLDEIRYDRDALAIIQHYVNNGYGDSLVKDVIEVQTLF